jgi:pimeloyl-ACP methyl ester carboxylesterase
VDHCAADVATIADSLRLDRFAVRGVSGGGPHAVAVAALLGQRVTRCATIVSFGPYTEPDLDFYAGMSQSEADEWRLIEQGGNALTGTLRADTAALLEAFPSDPNANAEDQMLAETLAEALAQGIEGTLDDNLSFVRPWGFDFSDVIVPTQIMIARDDESIPPSHGRWLADHIPTPNSCSPRAATSAPPVEPTRRNSSHGWSAAELG